MKKTLKTGFTLIELLVVITIIGLLSAMVLVGLSGVRAQGRDTRRIADLRNTQNALEIYFNANTEYPSAGDWESLETELINADIGVKKLPRDPLLARDYEYAVSGDGLHYVLKTELEGEDHQALREDTDGTVLTVDCEDPGYCIEL